MPTIIANYNSGLVVAKETIITTIKTDLNPSLKSMDDLKDVDNDLAPTDGSILVYNATSEVWESQENPDVTIGSLTKTFTADEEATITLSSSITTPIVSATYETPTTILTDNTWNVEVSGSDYDIEDLAYSDTLTPSATTGDITLTLAVGTWTTADVGKTVSGNGGVAVITSFTSATVVDATTTTDFTDTSTITSGSWTMYGLVFDATNGVQLSGLDTSTTVVDLSTGSYDSKSFTPATSNLARGFHTTETEIYILLVDASKIYQYTMSTPLDVTTATLTSILDLSATRPAYTLNTMCISNDGSKLYLASTDASGTIYQYTMSTPRDILSAGDDSKSVTHPYGTVMDLIIADSGNKFYFLDEASSLNQYSLSTPYDISTATTDSKSFNPSTEGLYPQGCFMSENGELVYIVVNADIVYKYDISTPFELDTTTYSSDFIDVSAQAGGARDISIVGTKMFLLNDHTLDSVFQYTIGASIGSTLSVSNQYFPAVTNSGGQIDSTFWSDLNSMTVTDVAGGATSSYVGDAYYAISTDDKTTFQINQSGASARSIARDNAGTWEYNSDATYASTTWTTATTNTIHQALSEAMTITANQMTGAELEALSDGEHLTLGTTLDLAIILHTNDATVIPSSDGASINYDANVNDEIAINGTDYTATQTSPTNVTFKALVAENFKIRII